MFAVYRNGIGKVIQPSAMLYTLKRDEIQGWLANLDDMHRTSRGDDMPSLRLG